MVSVAEAAVSMIGTPFCHQGRSPGRRLDCIGLLVCAHRAAGFVVQDDKTYGKHPNPHYLLKKVTEVADEIKFEDVQPGDFCLSWMNQNMRSKLPHHCAIFAPAPKPYSGLWIVHALQDAGRVVINPFAGLWPELTHSFWRWRR